MQKTLLLAAPLAALLTLGACNNKPTTIVAGDQNDPQAEALKNAPKIAPPPMIQASRTFRCKDNALVYADYYTNNTVQVHVGKKDATPVTLTGTDAKGPFTAPGYSLSANANQVEFTGPGHAGQSCKTR